jgi:predicted alpha/beta hydrolase
VSYEIDAAMIRLKSQSERWLMLYFLYLLVAGVLIALSLINDLIERVIIAAGGVACAVGVTSAVEISIVTMVGIVFVLFGFFHNEFCLFVTGLCRCFYVVLVVVVEWRRFRRASSFLFRSPLRELRQSGRTGDESTTKTTVMARDNHSGASATMGSHCDKENRD